MKTKLVAVQKVNKAVDSKGKIKTELGYTKCVVCNGNGGSYRRPCIVCYDTGIVRYVNT
jgi:hypothetical protein